MSQTDALKTIKEIKENTFIFEQKNALPDALCDDMVRRFEEHTDDQYQGRIGQGAAKDSSVKKTTDLVVSGKEHWKDVDNNLFRSMGVAIKEFREAYPYFKGPFNVTILVNITTGILMAVHMILVNVNS